MDMEEINMNVIVLIISIILMLASFRWEVGFGFSWLFFLIPALVQFAMVKLNSTVKVQEFLTLGFINLGIAIIIALFIKFIIGFARFLGSLVFLDMNIN